MLDLQEELNLAIRLDTAVRDLKKQLRKECIANLMDKKNKVELGPNYWACIYDYCVSLTQGAKSIMGNRFQDLVFDCIDKVTTTKVERQRKMQGFERKPLDGFLAAKRCDFYFSVAHTVRERKLGTWNYEIGIIKEERKKAHSKGDFLFVCIANEPEARAFGTLRANLNSEIRLVTTQNREAMRQLLTEISAADLR